MNARTTLKPHEKALQAEAALPDPEWGRKEEVRVWRQKRLAVGTQFLDDLKAAYAADLPIPVHNKASSMAWDEQHSNGYAAVEQVYCEYINLVRLALAYSSEG